MYPASLLPSALPDLYVAVIRTGKITLADRYGLMTALLQCSISSEDLQYINRLLHAIRRGRVQIVDELSALQREVEDDATPSLQRLKSGSPAPTQQCLSMGCSPARGSLQPHNRAVPC